MSHWRIIAKYLSGNTSADENEAVKQKLLVNDRFKADFDGYEKVWKGTRPSVPPKTDLSREWDRLKFRLTNDTSDTIVRRIVRERNLLRLAVAAVFLVFCSTAVWVFIQDQFLSRVETVFIEQVSIEPVVKKPVFITERSTDRERLITLPDQTVVKLKAGSSIAYQENFGQNRRELSLDGAAFFDVVKDPECPFVINAAETKTRVIGTSFYLRAYEPEDSVSIYVASGKVRFDAIQNGIENSILLSKGDFARYKRQDNVLDVEFAFQVATPAIKTQTKKNILQSPLPQKNKKPIDKRQLLDISFDWSKNPLNLTVVEGEIRNPTNVTFEKVRIKVTYFTDKKGKRASSYFMLGGDLKPSSSRAFKKKLTIDWLSNTSDIEVEIDQAEIISD